MKILITGCSGYIGSHLCKLLESENIEVHGLDIREPQFPLKAFYKNDIRYISELGYNRNLIYTKYDAVIHLAALVNVGKSERDPISYYITNVSGTINILETIDTDNFIFASTGAATVCESAYGISKRAAEDCVRQSRADANWTIFRFYNVIGSEFNIQPTNPDGLMYNLIKAKETGNFTIFGNDYNTPDGTCIRDYVHVMEICNAIKTAIYKPANNLENLGHGIGKSVKEMVNTFQEINDCVINIKYEGRRKGDAESTVLDKPSQYMQHLYAFEDLLKL